MRDYLLVSDVGSTTTKLLLLKVSDSGFVAIDSVTTSTTVEKPEEDVCIGFLKGVQKLQRSSGEVLLDSSGKLLVPYFTTSSAGGGLQILVVALASSDSGCIATAVAFSAGGVILDSHSIDDGLPDVEKIRRMKLLSPDLIILAGGYDNGATANVIRMTQLVAYSKPKAKYGNKKIPLIFCGNKQVRPFVEGILGDTFTISVTENIRPDSLSYNLKPAIDETHRLFMDHVMQMAPGYSKLSEMTSSPILPTPAAVNRILERFSSELNSNVILADMGGATTDIFSSIEKGLQRTVAANTGMSYSISNIVKEAGIDRICAHIPIIPLESVRNWILSKTLFPTIVPSEDSSEAIECAAAAEGMRLAWEHHLEIGYTRKKVGFLERLRRMGKCKFDPAFKTMENRKFRLSSISTIIGAGGIMAHSSPRRAAWILATGFRPKGLTTLMVDRHFHSPHTGLLLDKYPDQSLKYYKDVCLQTVCRVYSPLVKVRKLTVRVKNIKKIVKSGSFLYLESSEGVKISGVSIPSDDVPLLIDCRFGDESLPMDFFETAAKYKTVSVLPYSAVPLVKASDYSKEFNLAYKGEIFVKKGDRVKAGERLGENRLRPPRTYFVDIRCHVGYNDEKVSDDVIMSNILVKVGETVKVRQKLFSLSMGKGFSKYSDAVVSPIRGIVESIVYPGMIVIAELQDYDGKPRYIDIPKALGVKLIHFMPYMKVRQGEFVERGQKIAVGEKLNYIKAETSGTVLEINKSTGIVKIQYLVKPTYFYSPLAGLVSDADSSMKVVLSSRGLKIPGVVGFGKTEFGELSNGEMIEGTIVFIKAQLTKKLISEAINNKVAGIIAPSISGIDLIEFLGCEPGVILTGSEDVPFSLLILKGIGSHILESVEYEQFSNFFGENCVLFTTTRLRAGVERPNLFVQI